MSEVIKHGNYFNRQVVTCPCCECKFVFSETDKMVWTIDPFNSEAFVYCPECKERVGYKDKEI